MVPKGFTLMPDASIDELERELDILLTKFPTHSLRGDFDYLIEAVKRAVTIAKFQK